jgi:hypothetical protein
MTGCTSSTELSRLSRAFKRSLSRPHCRMAGPRSSSLCCRSVAVLIPYLALCIGLGKSFSQVS